MLGNCLGRDLGGGDVVRLDGASLVRFVSPAVGWIDGPRMSLLEIEA